MKNAGINDKSPGEFEDQDMDVFRRVLDINIMSAVLVSTMFFKLQRLWLISHMCSSRNTLFTSWKLRSLKVVGLSTMVASLLQVPDPVSWQQLNSKPFCNPLTENQTTPLILFLSTPSMVWLAQHPLMDENTTSHALSWTSVTRLPIWDHTSRLGHFRQTAQRKLSPWCTWIMWLRQ